MLGQELSNAPFEHTSRVPDVFQHTLSLKYLEGLQRGPQRGFLGGVRCREKAILVFKLLHQMPPTSESTQRKTVGQSLSENRQVRGDLEVFLPTP